MKYRSFLEKLLVLHELELKVQAIIWLVSKTFFTRLCLLIAGRNSRAFKIAV